MASRDDRVRPYRSLWPLPGGHGRYLASLLEIVKWVDENRPNMRDLQAWMRLKYGLGQESSTPSGYLQVISRMGYLEVQKNDSVGITQRARRLLTAKDGSIVVDGMLRECLGTYDVLATVARLGAANAKALLVELQERYPFWTTANQYDWRLQWLHSLGCLEKADGRYLITPAGQIALRKFAEHHASPEQVANPATPPRLRRSQGADTAPEAEADEIAPQAMSGSAQESEHRVISVLRDEADRLAERLRTAALESDDAIGYERVIAEALRFLGFEAEHKSGPGDTDVLVTALLGQETYRAVVDGKSSRHGKVGNQQIDWLALARHKQLHQADHILVVAPAFSSGDLLDNATKTDAALLSADDFAAVIRLHASSPLSLADLRELFRYTGHPELPLQRIQERAAEVVRLQRLIPDIVRTFEHSYRMGVRGPISADALHLILAHDYGRAVYARDEIVATLDLLCTPLIGALRRVSDTTFALQMPMASVGRRFHAQARQLADLATTPEAPVAELPQAVSSRTQGKSDRRR